MLLFHIKKIKMHMGNPKLFSAMQIPLISPFFIIYADLLSRVYLFYGWFRGLKKS